MKKLQKQIEIKQQMTCLQISELTGVRHDSVKRTVKNLSENSVISYPQIVVGKKARNGVTPEYYVFIGEQGERDSIIVIAQVSPKATAMLVDEWKALKLEVLDLRKHIADRQDARLQCPKMATALKEQRESLGKDSPSHIYSTDYDMLNRIVLGLPAKKYKESQSFDVNLPLRDTLTAGEIEAIKILQDMNTTLVTVGLSYKERKEKLISYFMRKLNDGLIAETLRLQG